MLDIFASYHCMRSQEKSMIQTQLNGKKRHFWPDLGPFNQIWAVNFFFKKLAFSVTKYHG